MDEGVFLEATNVSKHYGGVTALEDVDMGINRGEVHCLVGENGSGKSTLVKIITGVVRPESGARIEIEEEIYSSLKPIQSYEKGIQVVHQDLSMFPNLTIAENIGIGQYIEHGRLFVNWSDIKNRARKAFEQLDVEFALQTRLGDLSLADQQLVAICRALASDAKLLIMDEPTASLTQEEVHRLFEIIRGLKENGVTTLFISHRLEEVLEIGDRITVLRNGRKVDTLNKDEATKDDISYLMTGEEIEHEYNLEGYEENETLFKVENLTDGEHYKKVSFEVARGEVKGIIGPLGSGQTNLALSLFGLNSPEEGKIILDGEEVHLDSISKAMNLGIGYVPEDRLTQGVVLEQPTDNNLILTSLEQFTSSSTGLLKEDRQTEFVEEAVEEFDIKIGDPEDPAISLSGGNQQKVVVAKWVSIEPKLLIMNRPTHGIDIAAKGNIYDLISELAAKGMGIILISDEVDEVIENSHNTMVMKEGQIVDKIKSEELSSEELYNELTSSEVDIK
ncbi:sugar ABC transporter ATP-binding protein [Candidatus Bipolaricaulota bacterium]|nr:sugar ABC transporter ATP-binding protein [Candidatus Bipolaricaulota bacterium]